MWARVSNDFSRLTRKNSCQSTRCVNGCRRYASEIKRSELSCRQSLTKQMNEQSFCAWRKPSLRSSIACAALLIP